MKCGSWPISAFGIGQEGGVQAPGARRPGLAAVDRLEDPAAAHVHQHAAAVARVHEDRADPGLVTSAAEPAFGAIGLIPQRVHQPEVLAAIIADEQAARFRADVQALRLVLAAGLDQPQVGDRGRCAGPDLGPFREFGRGQLLPGAAVVAGAVELGAPVAVVQPGPQRAGARIGGGIRHRRAQELDAGHAPGVMLARQRDQALVGAEQQAGARCRHGSPPVSVKDGKRRGGPNRRTAPGRCRPDRPGRGRRGGWSGRG